MINLGTSTMQDFALGDNLVERIDLGDTTIFDAYTTLSGTLPLTFNSRAAVALKNYRIHGTSDGVGEETENLYNLRLFKDTYPDSSTVVGDTLYIDRYVPAMYNTGISADIPSGYYLTVTPTRAKSGTTAIQGKLRLIDENGTAHSYYITNLNGNPTAQISEQLSFAVKKICIDFGATMNNGFGLKQMMFTSTAPTTYIPNGYKIPILNTSGVTENVFDIVQYLTKREAPYVYVNGYYCFKRDASKFYYNKEDISDYKNEYLLLENNIELTNVVLFRIELLNEDSKVIKSTTSDTEHNILLIPENAKYLRLNWSSGGGEDIAIRISITEFSPDHYIPHRYESNYDLFIGDSKLYEDEYLDFVEQKVYKRTENLLRIDDDEHTSAGVLFKNNSTTGYCIANGKATGGDGLLAFVLPEISGDFYYSATPPNGALGTFDAYAWDRTDGARAKKWDGTRAGQADNDLGQGSCEIKMESGHIYWIVARVYQNYSADNLIFKPMLRSADSSATFVPYLQPTDPPVPLPPIPTYKGENTLSSTETLGEVTVKGRISAVSP